MEVRAKMPSASPNRDDAEDIATYVSEAVATGDRAVIDEALATLAQSVRQTPTLRGQPDADRHVPLADAAGDGIRLSRESLDPAREHLPQRRRRRLGRYALFGVAGASGLAGLLLLTAPEWRNVVALYPFRAAVKQSGAPLSNGTADHGNQKIAQPDGLQAQVQALAAEMGSHAMVPSAVPGHAKPVLQAFGIPPTPPAHAAPVAPSHSAAAPAAPGRSGAAAPGSAVAGPAPGASAAQLLQREQLQLVAARGDLAAGRTGEARQLIEAVQTQLVLQPITPSDPFPQPGDNATAIALEQALGLLKAGRIGSALQILNQAIANFGADSAPIVDTTATGLN